MCELRLYNNGTKIRKNYKWNVESIKQLNNQHFNNILYFCIT